MNKMPLIKCLAQAVTQMDLYRHMRDNPNAGDLSYMVCEDRAEAARKRVEWILDHGHQPVHP